MTKKIIAIAAVLAISAMTFAACGGSDNAETSDTTVSVSEETTAEETVSAEESVSDETIAEDDGNLDEVLGETENTESAVEESGDDTASGEETASNNPLMPAVEKALSESEWPAMAEITDETLLKEFFTIDPANENYSEFIVMQCPMSAVMSEIIIINAADVEAAKADLEARQTKAIEIDAWYPNDQELAEASIVGTNGSYAYFIIGENAAAAEKSINDYIASLA